MGKSKVSPGGESDCFGDLYALVGGDALFVLLQAWAGRRIQVPMRPVPSSLATLIGEEPARKIVAEYGGTKLTLPLAKAWRAQRMRQRGGTYSEIAVRLCMTECNVYRILRQQGMTAPRLSARKAVAKLAPTRKVRSK